MRNKIAIPLLVLSALLLATLHLRAEPCGNPAPTDPPCNNSDNGDDDCPKPPEETGESDDPEDSRDSCSTSAGSNRFNVRSGNVSRGITDLRVSGGVGTYRLNFRRIMTSRHVVAGVPLPFGEGGGSWRHNYSWQVSYAGQNGIGSEIIRVDYPSGSEFDFQKTNSLSEPYLTGDPKLRERIEPAGGGTNEYALWFRDGSRLAFYKQGSHPSITYTLRGWFDPYNNHYPFNVDGSGRVTKVTEPGGGYIDIRYGIPSGANVEVVTNVTASTGQSLNFLYGLYTTGSQTYTTVTNVNYGDGLQAKYTYTAPTVGWRPQLASADDPRYGGTAKRIAYEYNTTQITAVGGFVSKEKSFVSGTILAELIVSGTEDYERRVSLGSGGTLTFKINDWNGTNRTDTIGRGIGFAYDGGGRGKLTQKVDALGRTNTWERLAEFGAVKKVTKADGSIRIRTFTSDTKPFFIATITNEMTEVTSYTRDTSNRVTRVDHPDGSYETFTYNSFGQPLTHRLRNGGVVTNIYSSTGLMLTNYNAAGFRTTYTYDATNRLASATDPRGNSTSYNYNERGLVTKITQADTTYITYAYDTYGNRTNMVDELGHTWSYAYDEYNRMTSMTDPLNRTTTYSYAVGGGGCGSCHSQDKPTSITDPKGNVTVFVYDSEWQLVAVTNAEKQVTSWTYDSAGYRTRQIDANSNTNIWVYDSRNRVTAETNALGVATIYRYDAEGNLTNRVDGAGISTFWSYDSMNRVTSTGSGTLTYEYSYDLGGRRTGMVTRVNGVATETTGYTYDLRDLLLTKSDPTGYTLSYGYDSVGNRTNLSIASILSQSYSYDTRNRVTTMVANSATTTFSYDAASRRISAGWPNGTTTTNTYDNANQLLSLVHKTSGGSTIASFVYGYDLAGNRTNMTTLEGVNSYSYNSNSWLTAVTYPDARQQSFVYDPVGNRTSLIDITGVTTNTTGYSYTKGNRLGYETAGAWSYYYDGAGRLTNQTAGAPKRSFTYSFRSQMTSLTDTNAATFTYEFDGDGNRTKAGTSGCLTSRYVYDGPNVVLDLNASNQVVNAYVNGRGIDQPIERIAFVAGTQSTRLVYHADALGSVVAVTDSQQLTAKSYSYEAFGKVRTEAGNSLTVNRVTYTAREAIGDSLGLYYYRWRVMDPNVGRFTSEDPVGFTDGPNVYLYVSNDPVTNTDAHGLFVFRWWKVARKIWSALEGETWDPPTTTCYLAGWTDYEIARDCFYTCTDGGTYRYTDVGDECHSPECRDEMIVFRL